MRAPCWTCRSRTIQCDQSRTPCAKCEKAGLECLDKRPLRWVQGVAIRGKMRGRDPGKHHQVTDRQQPAQRKRNALSRTKSLTTNISPQFALQDPYVHHLDWSSRFYLDYCGFSWGPSCRECANVEWQTIYVFPNYLFYTTAKGIRLGACSLTLWMMQRCEWLYLLLPHDTLPIQATLLNSGMML